MQKLVTRGALHPAKVITRANSLVPLGGPHQSGLIRRPYFVSRQAMVGHIAKLSQYCEETWALRAHSRQNKASTYVYRHRRSPAEVEEARTQRALMGALITGLCPPPRTPPKAGGGGFAANFFPVIGQGRTPQAPYQTTRQRKFAAPPAPEACVAAVAPHTCARALDLCSTHQRAPCITGKRLRKSLDACCALGHHRPGYVDRLPLSVTCCQHGLPACARCTKMQRGVRNCCARGRHKVHTPVRKRPAAPDTRPAKRLRTARSPARTHMELPAHTGHTAGPKTTETPVTMLPLPPRPAALRDDGRGRARARSADFCLVQSTG